MARWTDLAKWVGPTPNQGGRMSRHDGVVIHIAAGYYDGTIAWQRNASADVSSHFIVARDGRIAQMVDTDTTAWTQRDGNGKWISIENEGFLPSALTAAQVEANARILAKAHQVYGVPLQVTGNPSKRGLGHHSMGPESGVNWGHSECPGPAIKAQKPAIVARAIQIINGEDDDMNLSDKVSGTDSPDRTVGLVFSDLANLRNAAISPPGAKLNGKPLIPEGSVLDLLTKAATRPPVALTDDDRADIAARVLAGLPANLADQLADALADRLKS